MPETEKIVRPSIIHVPEDAQIASESVGRGRRAKGRYRDVVEKIQPDGSLKVIEETGWNSNLIVNTFPRLLAALLANEPSMLGGILYSAQGEGNPAWDAQLQQPSVNDTQLVAEYFRKVPTAIGFRTPEGEPSPSITDIILIQTILEPTEANGGDNMGRFIREQGLFGGTATATVNSGLMVNHITHRARWKDATLRLTRYIELRL